MDIKKLREDLLLAKTDESYHRKQMEYQQEQIEELKKVIQSIEPSTNILDDIFKPTKKPKDSYDDIYCKTKCQQCGKPVTILKNHPYFGILCSECSKTKSYTSTKHKHVRDFNDCVCFITKVNKVDI